jgi:hypothetical protein
MFNPNIQYRCTIIRGKAQSEQPLPAYANIISEIYPCKRRFWQNFNENYQILITICKFEELRRQKQKKTIRDI